MRALVRLGFIFVAAGLSAAALSCAVGPEQEPGCHTDGDCGGGLACRAGACFQTEPRDAGDGG